MTTVSLVVALVGGPVRVALVLIVVRHDDVLTIVCFPAVGVAGVVKMRSGLASRRRKGKMGVVAVGGGSRACAEENGDAMITIGTSSS